MSDSDTYLHDFHIHIYLVKLDISSTRSLLDLNVIFNYH